MTKTLAYFFLLFTLFLQNTFAQENYLGIKQGLYSLNTGISNQVLTKKYNYGPGFHYRYSEDLEIMSLGLKHNFLQQFSLSYGLENYQTMRLGIKYPFYMRLDKNFKFTSLDLQLYFSDRYFPEFYSEDTLHFLSSGIAFKEKLTETMTVHVGGEVHRLFNREQIVFGNIFYALEMVFQKQYFIRAEFSDSINNARVPHIHDWLATATLGLIL